MKQDKCWIWKRGFRNGYGILGINKKLLYAHRVAYALFNGGIVGRKCVLHRCDNPACFNPKHLFLGTRTDNAKDRDAKGRVAHGENHYRKKLSSKDVKEIKALLKLGVPPKKIADSFTSVTSGAIQNIKSGKTWKRL